jgi:hypothetical protein
MKFLTNKKQKRELEEAYYRVIEAGPGKEIPPFEVSPKVRAVLREPISPITELEKRRPLSAAWLTGIAAACAVLVVCLFLFLPQPKNAVTVKTEQVDGHAYQVVSLDPQAALDVTTLKIPTAPALQPNPEAAWLLRSQPALLTDTLAEALAKTVESNNWKGVERALRAQAMELPATPPQHLLISDELLERIRKGERNIDLWVIHPKADVLVFRVMEK